MSQSPQTPPPVETPGMPRENLRAIATRQKGVLVCLLVYIVAVVARLLLHQPALGYVVGVAGVASSVFVFMLAIRLYGTGVGVLLGVLTLVPLLGLIVLLIVNGKATSTLKSHGIAVGILGADMNVI